MHSFGGYMHVDDQTIFDNETKSITHIGGKPIDMNKKYNVRIYTHIMVHAHILFI